MCILIMSILNVHELTYAQLELLRKGDINFEDLIFLSCTELKRYLRSQLLSRDEKKELSKLRKRGREKWLHVRECESLQAEIWQLEEIAFALSEEKLDLQVQIEKLKIQCFLAAPANPLYQYDFAGDTMDTP